MGVEYRGIEGFPGYRVGNDGSIWSEKSKSGKHTGIWKRLKEIYDNYGYVVVSLYRGRKATLKKIHRIVLEAFVGPCPENMEACHINNKRDDNRVENLIWGTSQTNADHRKIAGTIVTGSKQKSAKLKESDIPKIRSLHDQGTPNYRIAKLFGVHTSTIQRVTSNTHWKHV